MHYGTISLTSNTRDTCRGKEVMERKKSAERKRERNQPVLSPRGQQRLTGKPIEHVRNEMLKEVREELEHEKMRDRGGDVRKKEKSTPDALDDRLLECNPINGVSLSKTACKRMGDCLQGWEIFR
ncbi:hypothetical protein QQF64_030108 [Cirrhinus molitorella]|uniref:Uncharacterized protein n=1 Tax=Cirrhinus molitorella TaxID=172907 RepID=A0ABR3N2P7_9TELE